MIKMKHVSEAKELIATLNQLNTLIKEADKGHSLEIKPPINTYYDSVKVSPQYILYALYPQREEIIKRLIEIGVDIKE